MKPDVLRESELVEFLNGELMDLWKNRDGNREFLNQLAKDVIENANILDRHLLLAAKGKTATPRRYEANLEHLVATLDAEMARRKIRVAFGCKRVFKRVIRTVIRSIIHSCIKRAI